MSNHLLPASCLGHPLRMVVVVVCAVLFANPIGGEIAQGASCCEECRGGNLPEDDSSERAESWVPQSSVDRTRRPDHGLKTPES